MLAEEADLPLLTHDDPALAGDRFHEVLDDLASRNWLVRSDLGYLILGREPGMALLKDRRLSFPAVELLELQGLNDGIIYDFLPDTFTFAGNDCDALTERVLAAFIAKERNP